MMGLIVKRTVQPTKGRALNERKEPLMKGPVFVVLALGIALLAAGHLFAGGSAEQPKGRALKVAFVAPTAGAEWVRLAATKASAELGNVELQYEEPDAPTASDQARVIRGLIDLKVNAIAVSPDLPALQDAGLQEGNLLFAAVKKAIDAGIKVISFDRQLAAGGAILEVSSASDDLVGRALVKMMAVQIGDSGEIGFLSASPDAAYQSSLIESMKKELAAHPNMHLDAILYGNDQADKSARDVAAMLKAYPRIKGIIAPTPVGLAAAGKMLDATGLGGKVQLTGLGVPADMKPYIDDGTCSQMLLGIPFDTAYAALYVAAQLARGQIKGARGEILKVGRLGAIVVDENGIAAMSQPTVVTKDSIESFLGGLSN